MTAKTRRRIRQAILAAVACVAPFAIGVVPVDAATRSDATATPAPQQVADTACRQAAALEGAGQFTDALKAYEAAIAADPSNACGASGLKALVQGRFAGGQPCTVAAALHRAGDNATAKTILSDAIKSSSTDAVCAAKQLKAINEKSLADRAKSILETVAWCAAILAIPVLLALGILRLFPRPARLVRERISHYLRLHPQLVISDLGDYGGEPKAAATVGALVAARFVPVAARDSEVAPIEQVEAGAELGNAFDAVSKVSPQFAQLIAVVRAMQTLLGLPRRFSVAGQIHSSPMEGPGITLRLWDQGALCGATTIWRGSPNVNGAATIDDFRELVVPAAAWLQHELATVLDSDHTARSTTSVSYALLAAGIEAQRHGDQARAQIWFQRSLSVDPTHLRARVALALGYDQASDNYTDAEAYLLSTLFMVEAELA